MNFFIKNILRLVVFISLIGTSELPAAAPDTFASILTTASTGRKPQSILETSLTHAIMATVTLKDIKTIPLNIVREIPTTKLSLLTPENALETYRAMCPLFPNQFPAADKELAFVKWSDIPDPKLNALALALRAPESPKRNLFKEDANSWLQVLWKRGSNEENPVNMAPGNKFLEAFKTIASVKKTDRQLRLTNLLIKTTMENATLDDFLKIPIEVINLIKPDCFKDLKTFVAQALLNKLNEDLVK